MADEEGLRKEAVRRHMAGEDAASIARDLDRSERWVYKWTGRFETGRDKWFVSDSRRPNTSPAVTSDEMVALVIAARDRLETDPRAQRGTAAITWELVSMDVQQQDLPRPRTIEHIIKRSGRSKPRRRQNDRYEPKGTPYPARVNQVGSGVVHEADAVGPRYLDGAQEVYSFNLMDVGSHRVAIEPLPHPTPALYAASLVSAWRRLGIPEIAQFDNHPSVRGDIARPLVFGPVVRVCLDLGVKVRYIPIKEPWRNGAIEHFQDVFDKSFFRTERYRDLEHLRERATAFEHFHNSHHRYSPLKGKTPDEAWAAAGVTKRVPPKGYVIPDKLPQRGRIEVIRLIRSDRALKLFGDKIEMPEETVHQYVLATIQVRTRRLVVTFKGSTVYEAPHLIR